MLETRPKVAPRVARYSEGFTHRNALDEALRQGLKFAPFFFNDLVSGATPRGGV